MIRYRNLICDDEERRVQLLAHPSLNGIDYIEVPAASLDEQRFLHVHLIKSPPPVGLVNHPELFRVEGGVRIHNISVLAVSAEADHLKVEVEHAGDFSTYALVIESQGLDPAYARCEFNFKAGCPSRFDCKPGIVCPPEAYEEPLIDYMAKDYASFRQTLIDLIPILIPDWQERHEADLGIALVELLAYAADQLSYYQDAVANEAYLETARRRISVRRHARLIDYQVHDGASARAFIHLQLADGTSGTLPKGTQLLSRIDGPMQSQMPPHDSVIPKELAVEALKAASVVFETFDAAQLHHSLNEIEIYAWGNRQCCLPRGTTTLDLVGDLAADLAADPPTTWKIKPGDFLLLEEIKGPKTGNPADAELSHRQIVRLTGVEKTQDPLENQDLTRVTWGSADKLLFPLCLSVRREDDVFEEKVSVARGNLVLADHGRRALPTLPEDYYPGPAKDIHPYLVRGHRIRLREGHLSFRMPQSVGKDSLAPASALLHTEPRLAVPQVTRLRVDTPAFGEGWKPVSPHLLESGPFHQHFVVETDNEGRAVLRFGDGNYGMAPQEGAKISVEYRVGVGTAGNVGSESLVHIVEPEPLPSSWPDIAQESAALPKPIRNPLPAWGGIDPEPLAQVKQLAPAAFHATKMRAVTAEDYARAAELHPLVDKAVATFRWTGSWRTVFIAIDPVGRIEVTARLEHQIKDWVTRSTMTGYDLEIDPPIYVPLEIEIDVCVVRDHFRAEVEQAVLLALSHRDLPQGGRGFFHWDRFTFGQLLYLSSLYVAIEAVDGVDSAVVRRFIRLGTHDPGPDHLATRANLDRGHIPMDRLEVLRLDNDVNFPENGELRLNMMGGK